MEQSFLHSFKQKSHLSRCSNKSSLCVNTLLSMFKKKPTVKYRYVYIHGSSSSKACRIKNFVCVCFILALPPPPLPVDIIVCWIE